MSDAASAIRADYTRPRAPGRSRALLAVMLAGVFAAAALMPADGPIAQFMRRFQDGGDLRLGGDVRRTLMFLQQFGDAASSIFALLVIFLAAPTLRRRLPDAIGAWLAAGAAVQAAKMLIGRPRPGIIFGTPMEGWSSPTKLLFPWTAYPLPRPGPDGAVGYQFRHAWEFWGGISSDLWSMPSSHTSAAAALAVILTRLVPPLRPLMLAMVIIVAASRVLFGAHYPSDVVLGGAMGGVFAALAMDGAWGGRLWSRLRGDAGRGASQYTSGA